MNNDKIKSHNFQVRIYENNKDTILERLNSLQNIRHYAFICHDKDVDENGELLEKHTHLLVNLKDTREIISVKNYFNFYINGIKQNNHVSVIDNKKGAFEYLMHLNNEDKVQYEKSAITTDNEIFWTVVNDKSKYTCIDVVNDIIDGLSLRELTVKYGRDFVYHRKDYYNLCKDIKYEDEIHDRFLKEDTKVLGGEDNG